MITGANLDNDLRGEYVKVEKTFAAADEMTDPFSLEGLNYTVLVNSGGREIC